jgi:hypothetical protein
MALSGDMELVWTAHCIFEWMQFRRDLMGIAWGFVRSAPWLVLRGAGRVIW